VDSSKEALVDGVNYEYSINVTELIGELVYRNIQILYFYNNYLKIMLFADYLDETTSTINDNNTNYVSSSLILAHSYILYLILLINIIVFNIV